MFDEPEQHNRFGDLLNLSTLTLATCGPDSRLFAAPLFFVAALYPKEEKKLLERLYFFSEEKSQHSQNLENDPEAAVVIYPQCSEWQGIQGFQMRGKAFRVTSQGEWEYAWREYKKKFPFVSKLKRLIAVHCMYVFIPTWVLLTDNQYGFGHKQECNPESNS